MQKPSERLKKKVQKENLWLFILSLLRGRDYYGFEIRDAIKKRFGFWVGNVTSYKVLYLLKKGGYVSSFVKGNKKYYKITSKGEKELREAERFLKTLLK